MEKPILVVDDEQTLRSLLQALLEEKMSLPEFLEGAKSNLAPPGYGKLSNMVALPAILEAIITAWQRVQV